MARRDKIIGKSLDAKIQPAAEHFPELVKSQEIQDSFKELLNVSQIQFLTFKDNPNATVEALGKRVVHADGQKCERCWHWETDVGKNSEHQTICGRCVKAVTKRGKFDTDEPPKWE
jgi:isoleucyl-tRNA synthetase